MNRSRVGILPALKSIVTGKMPILRQDAYSTGATQGRFTRPLESAPTLKIIPLLSNADNLNDCYSRLKF
ncbi:MAG: hypothetical protein F6K26_41495 [Moorea sp. SIO2I5]|nr:hypothetical protein [Moorena sp. SIO2I5]